MGSKDMDNQEIESFDELDDESILHFLDIIGEKQSINVDVLLFNGLYYQIEKNKLNEELLELLIKNFTQYQKLYNDINSVEIIDDPFELELFAIINGNSKKIALSSTKSLNQEIKQAWKFIKNVGGA